jgi:hypothetical protein
MQQTKKWAGILLIFLIITAFLTGGGSACVAFLGRRCTVNEKR